MGCGRIVTEHDIQQLREARRQMKIESQRDVQRLHEVKKGMELGSVLILGTNPGVGLQMIRNSAAQFDKLKGDIGERATQNTLKGHNLNTTVGHNSKIYDVGSSKSIASVKTYGVGHGTTSKSTVNNYVKELRVATGRSRLSNDIKKFNAAASELREVAKKGQASFPAGLKNSLSDNAAAEWLRQNAELRIPDDHVQTVRAAVQRCVLSRPSAYGLPANASYAEKAALASQLMQQVQPMGISVGEIERALEKHL